MVVAVVSELPQPPENATIVSSIAISNTVARTVPRPPRPARPGDIPMSSPSVLDPLIPGASPLPTITPRRTGLAHVRLTYWLLTA